MDVSLAGVVFGGGGGGLLTKTYKVTYDDVYVASSIVRFASLLVSMFMLATPTVTVTMFKMRGCMQAVAFMMLKFTMRVPLAAATRYTHERRHYAPYVLDLRCTPSP